MTVGSTHPRAGADASETSPLLPGPAGSISSPGKWGRYTYLNIILVALLLTSCGDQLNEYASVKIFESIICYRFYEKQNPGLINIGRDKIGPGAIGGVDELHCKVDAVSADLAQLLGTQAFFDGLPNLLFCIPAGMAADRIGRYPFLILGVIAIPLRAAIIQFVMYNWQSLDVQWSWLSAAALVPAGGSYFTSTILYVICTDLTEAAERASVFFRLGAVNISASLLMPPLAAYLMERFNPWVPAFLGLALGVSCCFMSLFVPETLGYRQSDAPISPVLSPATTDSRSHRWAAAIRNSTRFVTSDWRVPALITTFLIYVPIGTLTQLLLQYISKRYALLLSRATLIITIREAVHVSLLLLILPYLQTLFLRILKNGPTKDLYLTRMSLMLTSLGWMITGVSPNIPILIIGLVVASLGSGASFVTRALLTTLLPQHHIARAFAVIGIISGLAQMFASPSLARLFKYGMTFGDVGMGLPFTVIGIISCFLTVLSFGIQLRDSEKIPMDNPDGIEDGAR